MFLKRTDAHGLAVGMVGVKLGDRLLQIGCVDGGRLGAIAGKVGLSGRAVAVVPDQSSADRAQKGAENAGVLVEVEVRDAVNLVFDPDSFDIVVVDDTAGLIGSRNADERKEVLGQLMRVLRPGGRAMIVGAGPRAGLGKLFGGSSNAPPFASSGDANKALEASGFKLVRTLADRDGLVFVEGVKPR